MQRRWSVFNPNEAQMQNWAETNAIYQASLMLKHRVRAQYDHNVFRHHYCYYLRAASWILRYYNVAVIALAADTWTNNMWFLRSDARSTNRTFPCRSFSTYITLTLLFYSSTPMDLCLHKTLNYIQSIRFAAAAVILEWTRTMFSCREICMVLCTFFIALPKGRCWFWFYYTNLYVDFWNEFNNLAHILWIIEHWEKQDREVDGWREKEWERHNVFFTYDPMDPQGFYRALLSLRKDIKVLRENLLNFKASQSNALILLQPKY